MPDADRRAAARRVARRDERIRAVIDIEQRALRALEQHGGARLLRAAHREPDVVGEREQPRCETLEHLHGLFDARAHRAAERRELRVGVRDAAFHKLVQLFGMAQIEHAHAAARDLVLIGGPDAAAGGADRLARGALAVHELVVRQHEMRAVAHVESALDIHAVGDEFVDLGEQRLGIEHDAVPDRAAHAGMQDAARDLVEHELAVTDLHGVPGVRAALIAHDPVRALGDHVDEFALPFVAPLCADHDDGASFLVEHWSPGWREKKGPRWCAWVLAKVRLGEWGGQLCIIEAWSRAGHWRRRPHVHASSLAIEPRGSRDARGALRQRRARDRPHPDLTRLALSRPLLAAGS